MIEFNLPLPPSANRLWRSNRGRVHRSPEYLAWLEAAGWLLLSQKPGGVSGNYKISINAVRPDKRRRDLGNLEKPISDLLVKHGVVDDDSLCEMICARWVTTGEGVTVRVEKAGVE